MQEKRRILIFGFSVSEQRDGYTTHLNAKLSERGFDCDIVVRAVGGMHPSEATYLFDAATPSGRFDIILLDLLTTGFRCESGDVEKFGLSMLQFVAKAMRRHGQVIFLNLPRTDVDYSTDLYSQIAKKIVENFGGIFLDIASTKTREEFIDILLDVVHTNNISADFYADLIAPIVIKALEQPQHTIYSASLISRIADSAQALLVSHVMPFASTIDLQRSFNPVGVALPGGVSISVTLYGKLSLAGLTYFMGPRTGRIDLIFDDKASLEIIAYDIFCYYNRLGGKLFDRPISSSSLTFRQSSDVPEINLHKGEKDVSERLGAIVHLLVDATPREELIQEWGHLWAMPQQPNSILMLA